MGRTELGRVGGEGRGVNGRGGEGRGMIRWIGEWDGEGRAGEWKAWGGE